jgi:hypothetical protein
MKSPWSAVPFVLVTALGCVPQQVKSQTSPQLPVYEVVQSGASGPQATNLANRLNLPLGMLGQSNGMVMFVDPSNYLAVPQTTISDSRLIDSLLAGSKNAYPSIPLSVQAIDFAALANLGVFSTDLALRKASDALDAAGLVPQGGTPVVGHTTFTAFYTNDNGLVISNSQYLDTQVNYQFVLPNGYPLVGPGAQVQMSCGPTGNVTRFLYAARRLTQGPMVNVIAPDVASNRLARLFPTNTTLVNLAVVYWSPPLLPWSVQPGAGGPTALLPWYVASGRTFIMDPLTGAASPVNLKRRMIPATDDPNFVPVVRLSAAAQGGTQVVASVTVSGGTPPYSYLWSGSDPAASTSSGPSLSYMPIVRIAPPPLALMPQPGNREVMVEWPSASAGFVLESSPSLAASAWTAVTNRVLTQNEMNSVVVPVQPSQSAFFRLRATDQALTSTDTVAVTVVDANGISQQVNQNVVVQLPQDRAPRGGPPVIGYGTESPREPDFAVDRIGWQQGMGAPFLGGGTEIFCWLGDTSWPGDFIEPPVPGSLPGTPWVYGDADYANWGVNTASIVLNNTDGAPDFFASSQPGATIAEYATAGLARPTNPGWRVAINWYQYGNTASTHYYPIDYNYSWGPLGPNDNLNWLCMDCCDALDKTNAAGLTAQQRWGPAFGGLHMLLGWNSEEGVGDGSFERQFALNMLGGIIPVFNPPLPVIQAWWSAAKAAGADHGVPAAMGPIGPSAVSDFLDYYWGKGKVNVTIPPSKITGWWYTEGP